MIKYAIALLFSVSIMNAQDTATTPTSVDVGDVFETADFKEAIDSGELQAL